MNMLLQYYGVRYLLERKMPWEIESRLWEIAGEKRDVEDIIFIYQRDAETMAECVRRYEARYACFLPEIYYTLINGTHTLKKRGKDYEMVQGT